MNYWFFFRELKLQDPLSFFRFPQFQCIHFQVSDKKILIDLRMIELGIAPESSSGKKLRLMLESLEKEDSRKSRRKFRKIWRKIVKSDPDLAKSLGLGLKKPSCLHMRNRRAWVRGKISKDIFQE